MKKSLIFVGMLCIGYANAQEGKVGINTDAPKATLDINPNTANAMSTGTTNEGLLIPRLGKSRVAMMATPETSTLVYVSGTDYTPENATTPTERDLRVAEIKSQGFYYYNGTKWEQIGAGAGENLYTADGTLSGNRKVSMSGHTLLFESENADNNVVVQNKSWYPLIVNTTNGSGGGLAVHPNNFDKRIEFSVTENGDARIWLDHDRIYIKRDTGNVGIGTHIPQYRLDVAGSSRFLHDHDHVVRIQKRNDTRVTDLVKRPNGTLLIANGTEAGTWYGGIAIGSTGNVGVGTETPSAKFEVVGEMKATSLTYTSDARLKTDVKSINNATASINALNAVTYAWNEQGKTRGGNDKLQYGFIAQEVEKVFPAMVNTDAEGYKSVNYVAIVPVLVKSLQERDRELQAMKAELLTLKQEVEKIKQSIKK